MGCNIKIWGLILSAFFLLSGCEALKVYRPEHQTLDEPEAQAQGVDVCHFDEPLQTIGTPPIDQFSIPAEDEFYEVERCRHLKEVTPSLNMISVSAIPLAFKDEQNPVLFRLGLKSTISGQIFSIGRGEISALAMADIRNVVTKFINKSQKQLLIVGHTDDTGSSDFNKNLSIERAVKFSQILVDYGMNQERILVVGMGEHKPIAHNNTIEGREKNRRIELIEYPKGGLLLSLIGNDVLPVPLSQRLERGKDGRLEGALKLGEERITDQQDIIIANQNRQSTINFGGRKVTKLITGLSSELGQIESTSIWDRIIMINSAKAADTSETLDLSCIHKRLNNSSFQRSLLTKENSKRILSGPYVGKLGLYGTSWHQIVNGQRIGLSNVAVLKNGEPETAPKLYIWKNYHTTNQQPDIVAYGNVTSIIGKKGLLYRVFFGFDGWPVRCIDLVFDRDNPGTFRHGMLYYESKGEIYSINFHPEFDDN